MTRFNYAIIALPGFTIEGPIDSYDFSTDKTMITITIDGTTFKTAQSKPQSKSKRRGPNGLFLF